MLVKMWGKQDPRTLLVGVGNGAATLENSLEVRQKVKHRVIVRPSNSTPRYMFKRNENICPPKNLYMKVHSSIILTAKM